MIDKFCLYLQVGLLLAQIGEFAFVLLSRASNLHIVEVAVYSLPLKSHSRILVVFILC